eukprot:4381732-Amphidinium_carterae.2
MSRTSANCEPVPDIASEPIGIIINFSFGVSHSVCDYGGLIHSCHCWLWHARLFTLIPTTVLHRPARSADKKLRANPTTRLPFFCFLKFLPIELAQRSKPKE